MHKNNLQRFQKAGGARKHCNIVKYFSMTKRLTFLHFNEYVFETDCKHN